MCTCLSGLWLWWKTKLNPFLKVTDWAFIISLCDSKYELFPFHPQFSSPTITPGCNGNTSYTLCFDCNLYLASLFCPSKVNRIHQQCSLTSNRLTLQNIIEVATMETKILFSTLAWLFYFLFFCLQLFTYIMRGYCGTLWFHILAIGLPMFLFLYQESEWQRMWLWDHHINNKCKNRWMWTRKYQSSDS